MPTRPGTGVACSLGARRAPNLNRLNLNYTWGPPIGALWGTAAPGTAPLWGGDPRGAGRCSFGRARALSHHSGFVDPRLLDVATGGVWDSFVLLPRILGRRIQYFFGGGCAAVSHLEGTETSQRAAVWESTGPPPWLRGGIWLYVDEHNQF